MEELKQYIKNMINEDVVRFIISNPKSKKEKYKKIVVEKKEKYYQICKYDDKQVFHENIKYESIVESITSIVFNN